MARFIGGWLKTWRKAWESDLSQNINLWGLWMAFLHIATWKESKILWAGKQRTLPPGTVVFGFRELAEKLEVSRSTIAKWSKYLHETQRIVLETGPHGSIATICNWEVYQGSDEEEQPLRSHGAATPQPQGSHALVHGAALSEEGKKGRKKNSPRREYPTEFEEIYRSYPKQEGKKAGFEVYSREIRSEADRTELIRAIENYRKRKQGTDAQYLLMFSTFMNQWTDWLDEKAGTTQLNPQPKLKGLKELEAELGQP